MKLSSVGAASNLDSGGLQSAGEDPQTTANLTCAKVEILSPGERTEVRVSVKPIILNGLLNPQKSMHALGPYLSAIPLKGRKGVIKGSVNNNGILA